MDYTLPAWIMLFCSQVVLVAMLIWWTTETESAFDRLKNGHSTAMKDYKKKMTEQLNTLIRMVQEVDNPLPDEGVRHCSNRKC